MICAMLKSGSDSRISTKEQDEYGIRVLVRDIEAGTREKEGDDLGGFWDSWRGRFRGVWMGKGYTCCGCNALQAEIRFLPTLSSVSSGDRAGKEQTNSRRLKSLFK
jgi:hypothetical protein